MSQRIPVQYAYMCKNVLAAQHKKTLKLVKYLWTEIQNLDGIGDFGWTENELLDSMFVQSLTMHCG